MIIDRSNKAVKTFQCPIPPWKLNKINLIVIVMAVLMLDLIPVVYAHNQDWNDGFKSGAADGKTMGMGALVAHKNKFLELK